MDYLHQNHPKDKRYFGIPQQQSQFCQRFTDEKSKAFSSPTNLNLHKKSVDNMSLHEWERFPLFGPTYVMWVRGGGVDVAAALSGCYRILLRLATSMGKQEVACLEMI